MHGCCCPRSRSSCACARVRGGCRGGCRNCRPGFWILKKAGNCWMLTNHGFCILRRGCWILPQHPESRKTCGNWMLDGPARMLDSAAASRIPQNAWKLYSGRPGADSGFCRSIQNPPKRVDFGCWTARLGFWILRSIQNPPKGVETGCWTTRRGFWILPQNPASRIQHPRTAYV